MKKEINLKMTKNKDGYIVGNETLGKIDILTDSDEDRKALINIFITEFLNVELEGGKKYN